jgi:arylformamidase
MYIDLTHTLANGITYFPGTLEPSFDQLNTIENDGYAELRMTLCTHTGTHMDAPAHLILKSKSIDQIPLDDFIGKGYVVNCKNVDEITVDLLKKHKDQISEAQFVLFYTGWDQKWNTPDYFNAFPVLTEETTQWLLQFPIKGIGFDSISADLIDSVALSNHFAILGSGILIIENLCHLDQLINKKFDFYSIPLKIGDGDGSPVRAFAKIEFSKN